jgi:hypothetical protein
MEDASPAPGALLEEHAARTVKNDAPNSRDTRMAWFLQNEGCRTHDDEILVARLQ